MRAVAALIALTLAATPVLACDIGVPAELKWSPKKVPPWVVYDFTPKAMVDGKLLYRKVKNTGLPSGATEQKILTEHVSRAFAAMYGGKAASVKIVKSAAVTLKFPVGMTTAKEYQVELKQAGDPTPKFAGVVIRENKAPKDIAVIVTPQDPDAPGDDIERMIGFAKKFASHPGFECTDANMP